MNRRSFMRAVLPLLVLPGRMTVAAGDRAGTLTDMLGRAVRVPSGPLRVVSLAPSLTEIVFALGRGDWLQAVTDFCNYPPAARSKPRIGGPAAPNLERIVEIRPSLVLITAEGNPRDLVARLERLGIPAFAVTPEGYAGVLASIRAVGEALHAEPEAADLVREIGRRVAAVQRQVGGRPRPRTLLLVWTEPLIAAAAGTVVGDLLLLAGGENVVRARGIAYPHLGWEDMVGEAPEVIVVADHREPAPGVSLLPLPDGPWSRWPSIPAVRHGRVVALPADPLLRPGPRVAQAVELLARALHPGVFARASRP